MIRRIVRIGAAAALVSLLGCGSTPQLREGLWDVRGQRVDDPGAKTLDLSYRLCRNRAFDHAEDAKLKEIKGCATSVKRLDATRFASASTCRVLLTTIVSKALVTYKSRESVHSETRADYSPPLDGKTDETLTLDQTYVGKCPSDMQPGDTLGPNGIILHHEQ